MLIVGLTGGIGSGKSTVASLFAKQGVPIIDSDIIARDITESNYPAFKKIISHFGNEILLDNGNLDRKKLRDIIFKRPQERQWLNDLLHPLIIQRIEEELHVLSAPYCIIVIPLLLETGPYGFINRILVVDTTEETQIKRTIVRDQSETETVNAILQSQTNRRDRLKQAHDVIVNEGCLADLIPQVEKLHKLYMKLGTSHVMLGK